MKYSRTDSFKGDYKKLSASERELFRAAVRDITDAMTRHVGTGTPVWPATLRIKSVQGAAGIFEMTWSFAGPDGRATFEIRSEDGEQVMLWRRIGSHAIFRKP